MKYCEVENYKDLKNVLNSSSKIENTAFQNLDLLVFKNEILKTEFSECIFLGCTLNNDIRNHLETDNYIFPNIKMPYNVYQQFGIKKKAIK